MQQQLRGVPSPYSTQSSSPSTLINPNQLIRQTIPQNVTAPLQVQNQPNPSGNISQMLPDQMGHAVSSQSINLQSSVPRPLMKDKKRIWMGIIEYQERPGSLPAQSATDRITYSLHCHITSSADFEINTEKWPPKLVLQLLPRNMIARLFNILKNHSHMITFHFSNQESEGYQKLSKIMSNTERTGGNAWVGCIQLSPVHGVRMIIVIYMPEKKLFMGFIPIDQEAFFSEMRNTIEEHRKDQAKQKMVR